MNRSHRSHVQFVSISFEPVTVIRFIVPCMLLSVRYLFTQPVCTSLSNICGISRSYSPLSRKIIRLTVKEQYCSQLFLEILDNSFDYFNGSERTLLAVITKVGPAARIFHIFSRSVFTRVTEVAMFNYTAQQKDKLEFPTSVLIDCFSFGKGNKFGSSFANEMAIFAFVFNHGCEVS